MANSFLSVDRAAIEADNYVEYVKAAQQMFNRMDWLGAEAISGVNTLPRVQNLPTPEKSPLANVTTVDAEYLALAGELGIESPAVLQARLETFFAEEHIEVYPLDKVAAYMQNLALKESTPGNRLVWVWKPLRQQDALNGGAGPGFPPTGGSISAALYPKAVPFPVLLTVKRIMERFGAAVKFFVSDYEVRKPDPFLMVTAPGLPQYVIERWDEPAFRS